MIVTFEPAVRTDTRRAPTIHLIGDSTMADKCLKTGTPVRGWGQLLPEIVLPGARVLNHARDGRSSKSFIWEGLWDMARASFHPGDWLVIQFGHNDQKLDRPLLGTEPDGTYRQYLTRFVREADALEVNSIFATSICRRCFSQDGRVENTLGDYPAAMRETAKELEVPLIDLNEQTELLLHALGPEKSKALFLHFARGGLACHPEKIIDGTLLSLKGARTVADIFAQSIHHYPLGLARWLKPKKRRATHGNTECSTEFCSEET